MTAKTVLDSSNGDLTALRVQAIVFALQYCNTQAASSAAGVLGVSPDVAIIAEDLMKVLLGQRVTEEKVTTREDNVIRVDFGKGTTTE